MSIAYPQYPLSRSETDLRVLLARTAHNLIACFVGLYPDKTSRDYQSEVFEKVQIKDDFRVEDPAEIFMQFLPESDRGKDFVEVTKAPLLNATAYFCRAMNAYDAKQEAATWSYLVDANYWCGFSTSYRGISDARDKTIADTEMLVKTKQGEKGGTTKGLNSAPYKLEAEQLVRTLKPKWPSRRQAVLAVLEKLNQEYAKRNQLFPLKYDAISLHFASLPDAKQLFEK